MVLAVQLLIVFSVIGFKQYTVWTGETVRLAVAPVDPRDPFRGDYVTFQYDISRVQIEPKLIPGEMDLSDETVYVEIGEGEGGIWEVVAIHDHRTHEFDDTAIIKGKIRDFFGGPGIQRPAVVIRYGIEDLFIPEGSGQDIPFGPDVELAVEVKVDRFGNAVPRHLLADGERFDLKRR
jgi:uncharacterized membrane-anchored protein